MRSAVQKSTVQAQPLIAVRNVRASSRWYAELLGADSLPEHKHRDLGGIGKRGGRQRERSCLPPFAKTGRKGGPPGDNQASATQTETEVFRRLRSVCRSACFAISRN